MPSGLQRPRHDWVELKSVDSVVVMSSSPGLWLLDLGQPDALAAGEEESASVHWEGLRTSGSR